MSDCAAYGMSEHLDNDDHQIQMYGLCDDTEEGEDEESPESGQEVEGEV